LRVDGARAGLRCGILRTRVATNAGAQAEHFREVQTSLDLEGETAITRTESLSVGGEDGSQPHTYSWLVIISPETIAAQDE